MSDPKTLHLTNFFHQHSGGIGAFYRALMAHADRCGRQMRLVVPGERSGCEVVSDSVKIYTVCAPRSPWIDERYRLLLPFGPARREIADILREEQPDILEVADKYSLPYISGMVRKRMLRGIRRPTEIATSHERMDDNVRTHLAPGLLGRMFSRWYMRSIYFAQFDHHIANSQYTAEELIPASRGHTTRRGIWVCPMGVDTRVFTPLETGRPDGRRLLYAGRLAREKNIGLLIDVMDRLEPEYTLDVLGDGPEREWFEQEAQRRAPGRVRFHGYVADRSDYIAHLRRAGAFLHPNPSEPFGIGPLEAMACGIPVVAPESGGVLSYASQDNAWLCDPEPEAFAAAVRSVVEDSQIRACKVANARAAAEAHDWTVIAARFFELLDTLHRCGFEIDAPPLGQAIDAWRAMRARRRHSSPQTEPVAITKS